MIFFVAQDEKKSCLKLGLLFYCKKMLNNLLANQCTALEIVDVARAIASIYTKS